MVRIITHHFQYLIWNILKILFDHQTFSIQRYGGISRYFANLSTGLNKMPGINTKIAALYSDNEYIKNVDIPLNNAFGKKLFTGHFNRIYRWNSRYCILNMQLNNFDVFHPTYYDPYFFNYLKKPFAVTVHDMIHELVPEQFDDHAKVIAQKKVMIQKADAIIAISEYTKQDIIKFYPQVENKITVVHHGYAFPSQNNVNDKIADRFILYVGERHFYKNFTNFIKAIAPLLNEDPQLNLICAGGGKFTAHELQLLSSLNIQNQCKQISATDVELQQLYKSALLFAFPSFLEGFGLPLLEAFHAGCPVAASNASCFPEIGGDAIAYFDPHTPDSIYGVIRSILKDDNIRADLINKGKERVRLFSIEKQIADTLAVYKKVI